MPLAGQRLKALDFTPASTVIDATAQAALGTTLATGTPTVAITFTAPTSGKALLCYGLKAGATSNTWVILTPEVYLGTNATGTQVLSGGDGWSIELNVPNTAVANATKSMQGIISGLTPGSSYYFRIRHRAVAAAVANISWRSITCQPLPA